MVGSWLERELRDREWRQRFSISISSLYPPVGIVSAGMYLPEPVLTAADIAEESGLPEWGVREKRCGEGVVLY